MAEIMGFHYIWVAPGILLLHFIVKLLRMGHRDKRLPPGPPTLPILGNIHQVPFEGFHKKMQEWSEKYGKVFSLKYGSGTVIVLNDRRAVHDLVDKKSAIYSARPFDHQWESAFKFENLSLMTSNKRWRAERKVAAQNLAPAIIDKKFTHISEAETCQLLHDLLETPKDFTNHIRRTMSSIGTIAIFGFRGATWDSFWAQAVFKAMDVMNPTVQPGTYPPVEHFPILRYIPERFAPWKRSAEYCYKYIGGIWGEACDRVAERQSRGDDRDSLCDRLLAGKQKCDVPLNHSQLAHFLGGIEQGAAHTTASTLNTMMLCLAMHPRVQEKAQEELDRVCGTDRLPTWEDFPNLPYINCIQKENLRFRPTVPAGLAHRNTHEDSFDGKLIPKDSMIYIPIWALHHTEYEDPSTYNPDRFLNHPKLAMDYAGSPDYMNRDMFTPRTILANEIADTGRRICVGIHLAERTQFRSISKILWAFKIEPPLDPVTGKPVELDLNDYTEGFLIEPKPFQVRITPRSEKHAEVIRKTFQDAKELLKAWE